MLKQIRERESFTSGNRLPYRTYVYQMHACRTCFRRSFWLMIMTKNKNHRFQDDVIICEVGLFPSDVRKCFTSFLLVMMRFSYTFIPSGRFHSHDIPSFIHSVIHSLLRFRFNDLIIHFYFVFSISNSKDQSESLSSSNDLSAVIPKLLLIFLHQSIN